MTNLSERHASLIAETKARYVESYSGVNFEDYGLTFDQFHSAQMVHFIQSEYMMESKDSVTDIELLRSQLGISEELWENHNALYTDLLAIENGENNV